MKTRQKMRACFNDESTFECQQASAKCVWHIPSSPPPVSQSVKHPTKVMVWSIISYEGGAGPLHICEGMMNAAKYLDVLQNRMLPQLRAWYNNLDDCYFMLLQNKH